MILESVKSFERLRNFHLGFDRVHDYIKSNDLYSLPVGLFEIDGRRIYGEVCRFEGAEAGGASLEVHDAYIEIYIVLEGDITFGYRDRVMCDDADVVYDEIGDMARIPCDPAVYMVTTPGNMLICFPKDAHNIVMAEGIAKYLKFRIKV